MSYYSSQQQQQQQTRWRSFYDLSEEEFTGHYESFVSGIGFWLQDYARLHERNYFFEILPWMQASQDDTSITTIVGVFGEHHGMVILGHHINGKIDIYEEYKDNNDEIQKTFLGAWTPDLSSTEDLMTDAFSHFILLLIDYFTGESITVPGEDAYWRPAIDDVDHIALLIDWVYN